MQCRITAMVFIIDLKRYVYSRPMNMFIEREYCGAEVDE